MDYLIQSSSQLSSQLRALRKARGLTQSALGAMLGVGQARVARIERSPETVSVDQCLQIIGILGGQMLLRAEAATERDEPPAADSRKAPRKVRATDEPW